MHRLESQPCPALFSPVSLSPFESGGRCRISLKAFYCRSPLLGAISCFLRRPIFFRQFPSLRHQESARHCYPFPEVLTSMNYSAMRHENLAIPIVFHNPLDTFASRNLIDTTKQFHRVTRLYGVQPVSGCCGRIEGFQKIPRGGSRGALTRIFPAVSPGRGSVVRGRLLVPRRACQPYRPCSTWSCG